MKIAYLMNGVIGGLSGKNHELNDINLRPLIVEYTANTHKNLYKDNIDIDYFIFTWEPSLVDIYNKFYSPKKIKAETQKHFNVSSHLKAHESNPRVQAHYSRWYGAKQVMNLCNEYAIETDTYYDLVINARLDLCYHNPMNLDKLDSNKMHIAKLVNNLNYGWPNGLPELIDHIFASNINTMNMFLNLYDDLSEFTNPTYSTWQIISNHFLVVHKLKKMNILNTETINKTFNAIDKKCQINNTDYHIFRYENLTEQQLKDRLYELQRN